MARGIKRYAPPRGALLAMGLAVAVSGCGGGDFELIDIISFRGSEPRMAGERRPALPEAGQSGEISATPANISAASLNGDWSNPGGTPANAPGHVVAGSGAVAFATSIGRGSGRNTRISATPIVSQGILVAIDGEGSITAVSASGGGRSWSTDLQPEDEDLRVIYGGGLAADNGRVFVNTPFGQMVALDLASGRTLWAADLPEPPRGAPTAAGGQVYVVSANNAIYALDQASGDVLWSFDGIPERAGLLANASPAVSGSRVVVPFTSGEILAFETDTGTPVWGEQLAGQSRFTAVSGFSDVAARPVISDGVVYAIGVSGRFVATQLESGERLWNTNLSSAHTPAISGDSLFVVTLTGDVVAVDRTTGTPRWETRLTSEERASWAGPLLAGNALWIGSSTGRLVRIDPVTGQIVSDTEFGTAINIAPIAAGGVIYILDDDGRVTALN
ncbi:MAG: PQQ-binding-like beta-propeller repeat protein [Pseudomonadota bacterium]